MHSPKIFFIFIFFVFVSVERNASAGFENGVNLEACPKYDAYHQANQSCIDVGCRPSLGECYNSCADHRAIAVRDNRCDDRDVRCYCKVGRLSAD